MQRVSFRIPADTREDVLDGVLPLLPTGIIERPVSEEVIEGSGFGSGSHPTTQMCLGLLLKLEPSGGAFDYGCGAGTLAIAAAKLGWAPVSGVDREERAIEEAHENARRNEVEAKFAHADIATTEPEMRE